MPKAIFYLLKGGYTSYVALERVVMYQVHSEPPALYEPMH